MQITERENVVLKEKLTTLRDELVEATKQLNTESNLTSNLKSQIESQTGVNRQEVVLLNIYFTIL